MSAPMKPHEETWYEQGGDVFVQTGPERGGDDHLVMYGDNRGPRKALIAAAPEMARAMLALGATVNFIMGPEWHLVECPRTGNWGFCMPICVHARHVLVKAGVL